MDRIGAFATYYGCQPNDEPATEMGPVAAAAIATVVGLALTGAIVGVVELALRVLDKLARLAWTAFKNDPKVIAKEKKIAEEAAKRSEAKKQAAFQKKIVAGKPYFEWLNEMDTYQQKYGPTILKLHKECCDRINTDMEALVKSKNYKGYPILWHAERNTYNDIWFTCSESHPQWSFSSISVGETIPIYVMEYMDDETIDNSYSADDEDKKFLRGKIEAQIKKYISAANKIVEKHVDEMVKELNKAGIKTEDWDYDHMSDEFLYERILINLVPPFKS